MQRNRGKQRLEISSRKLEISRDGLDKGQIWYGPYRNRSRGDKNTKKKRTKKIFMTQIIMMV